MKPFYERREWVELRYRVLRNFGYTCMSCNASRESGAELHVDHIKPISRFPELALTESNLQVLCRLCNLGKSNHFDDDLRPVLSSPERQRRRPRMKRTKEQRRIRAVVRLSNYIRGKISESERKNDCIGQNEWMRHYLVVQRKLRKEKESA